MGSGAAGEKGEIVVAEDDDDDFLLIEDALGKGTILRAIRRVRDGEELLELLNGRPHPLLILLDLNMPRKDGREVLREIKSDPALRRIPVVILTTSGAEADLTQAYDLGVNSFIRKPASFERLVESMGVLKRYWLEVVRLPS